MTGAPMTDVVFVHGALVRDGAWWWQPTAELLRERLGIRSRAVLLPTVGETGGPAAGADLHDDSDALRAVLDDTDSAVVVGHSYGGTVIADAGHHPAVRSLVYVSSYLPAIGEAQGGLLATEPDPVAVTAAGEGEVRVDGLDLASFAARFLQDADAETQRAGWDRVTPQSLGAFTTPTRAAGWVGTDTTYLVCTDDRSTTVALQRDHAARATRSIDLPTGHHPFLTRPDLVAGVLADLLAREPGAQSARR